MKNIIEKAMPAHVPGGWYESLEKIMDVFNEFIKVGMKFEVTMGVYGERLWACRAWRRLHQISKY